MAAAGEVGALDSALDASRVKNLTTSGSPAFVTSEDVHLFCFMC